MRTFVYVDGFNLYYGSLKGTEFKWLDLKALSTNLLPRDHIILCIKYFTARVSGAIDPDAPRRQATYLKALRTTPELKIYYGNFLSKTIWRPIINLPVGNQTIHCTNKAVLEPGSHTVDGPRPQVLCVGNYPIPGAPKPKRPPVPHPHAVLSEVHAMEEKGSDVNLAVHLLNDAWNDLYDTAIVFSSDTDLVTPVHMVTQERGKKAIVVSTHRKWPVSKKLRNVATSVLHIRRSMLASSQFPDPIVTPDGPIAKPAGW